MRHYADCQQKAHTFGQIFTSTQSAKMTF